MSDKEKCNNDETLILKFKQGSMVSFDELVMKYKDKVFNLCYNFLGFESEAEDMAQDVFVKVYYSLKSFKGQSLFSTWLYRITVNTCKNRLRSLSYRRTQKQFSLNQPKSIDDPHSIEVPDIKFSPSQQAERKETLCFIWNAIRSLPIQMQTLIILRDFENKSYEEIMDLTGLKLGTLKSKLARARKKLRPKLQEVLGFEV